SAHCSAWAPGGVSQRTCQSLWTDLTAPCAAARSVVAARLAPAITATASSAFIVWKSIRRLKEAIVFRASNPARRPAMSYPADSPPPTMLRPQGQGLVKHRIVAEKGSKRRPATRGAATGLWSHGRYERVHCDGAGIMV